jgi:hypothetical protein
MEPVMWTQLHGMVPILSRIRWCENVYLDILIIAHFGKIIVQEILQTMVIIINLCRNFLQIFTGTYAVVKCKSDLSSFHFSLLILFYSKLFLSLFPKHGQTYYVLIITNMHMLPFSYPRLAFKNLADIKIRTQLNPKFGSEFCRLLSKFTKTQFEL